MFFLFSFLPLSSLERKRLKKTSFILTEREDESQRARETEKTLPHSERRREQGSTHRERVIAEGLPVHLPFYSVDMIENEHSVEAGVCSSFDPSSFWLPSVSILLH